MVTKKNQKKETGKIEITIVETEGCKACAQIKNDLEGLRKNGQLKEKNVRVRIIPKSSKEGQKIYADTKVPTAYTPLIKIAVGNKAEYSLGGGPGTIMKDIGKGEKLRGGFLGKLFGKK